jgi:hypothetical protein
MTGADVSAATVTPVGDTLDMPRPLSECDDLADFAAGYQLGYAVGVEIGWRRGYEECADDHDRAWGLISATLKAAPSYQELAERRAITHEPCLRRCKACSQCIHSLAYWGRGGRDYQGADAMAVSSW